MRALRKLAGSSGLAVLAGCTLIATFDDIPATIPIVDETTMRDAGKTSSSSSSSGEDPGTVPDAGPKFPPECDDTVDLNAIGCGDYIRSECEDEPQITPKDGLFQAGDLIDCDGNNKAVCVRHCPNGCASMPAGFPDYCDDCQGRADGTYCAKDFRSPIAANENVAITCAGGRKAGSTNCTNGCVTDCPDDSLTPSCCQP